jgi:dihydroneopterin aldolase
MSDLLRIEGLRLYGKHGVSEEERAEAQLFEVDLGITYDQRRAAITDDLDEAVDVRTIAEEVRTVVEGEPLALLETMAQRIADGILAIEQVQEVRVSLSKMEARLCKGVAHPYQVEIRRTREDAAEDTADYR